MSKKSNSLQYHKRAANDAERLTIKFFKLLYVYKAYKAYKGILRLRVRITACAHLYIYGLRHRKCGVRGYMHELFVSKTRTSEVRASEGF